MADINIAQASLGSVAARVRTNTHFRRASMHKDDRLRVKESMHHQKTRQLQKRRATALNQEKSITSKSDDTTMDLEKLADNKREIESKLHLDQRRVDQLKTNLFSAQEKTNAMTSIFDSFGDRLKTIENNNGPMDKSNTLTLTYKNLEKSDIVFDQLMSYYTVYQDTKDILKDSRKITQDSAMYLENLEKAISARHYFETNKLRSAEESLSLLRAVSVAGVLIVQREFTHIVKSNSTPINVQDFSQAVHEISRLLFDKITIEKLQVFAQFLIVKVQDKGFCKELEDIRSECLYCSLLNLTYEDQTGGAPQQKEQKSRIPQFKSDQVQKSGKQIIQLNYDTSKLYEKGTHPFLVVIKIFTAMVLQEKRQFVSIMGDQDVGTFELAIAKPVELFVNTGDHHIKLTEAAVAKQDFTLILFSLDILESLNGPNFQPVIDIAGQSSSRLTYLNNIFAVTCAKGLNEFSNDLKKSTHKVSQDGTVHALTVKYLSFLARILEYKSTVEQVLKTGDVGKQDENRVSSYILKVIHELRIVLQSLAHHYVQKMNDETLQSIFLINNFNYILKAVKSGNFGELVDDNEGFNGFQQILEKTLSSQVDVYISTFQKCLSYIDVNDNSRQFSKNQKNEYKDRYKGFNTEFEHFKSRHKTYAVPDSEIRTELSEKLQNTFVPVYKSYRAAADQVNFGGKDATKYAKYSIQSLRIEIQRFFSA